MSTVADFSSNTTTLASNWRCRGTNQERDLLFNRGTLYYWRVTSTDNFGNETVSETNTFRVRAKSLKYDLAIGTAHSSSTPSFAGSDAVYHRENITLATHTIPSATPLDEIGQNGSGDKYFWKVTATDEAGNSRTSTGTGDQCLNNSCLSFTLEDDFPPSIPMPVYPKAGDVLLNQGPVFLGRRPWIPLV